MFTKLSLKAIKNEVRSLLSPAVLKGVEQQISGLYAAHLIREVSMTSHEADVIICLMYNLKQYTCSTCTDIQAWEHKLTFD